MTLSQLRLQADVLHISYGDTPVLRGLDLALPAGDVTAIIGANGCGKSTLLRALGRLLAPPSGVVLLDGGDVHRRPTREVARELGLLPQGATCPEGLTVEDLVARGRFPHRGRLRPWTAQDQAYIEAALEQTNTVDLRDRPVDQLSGGQRQRAWIAMALAQNTPTMLLDEPTTYLDLAHQVEVLDLLVHLNKERGRTVVLVLHDLNQAGRYADRIVAMRDGRVVSDGTPAQVLTQSTIQHVFGLRCRIVDDPESAVPLVVPCLGAR
jgi:iron complex transport system ATP-binding protein